MQILIAFMLGKCVRYLVLKHKLNYFKNITNYAKLTLILQNSSSKNDVNISHLYTTYALNRSKIFLSVIPKRNCSRKLPFQIVLRILLMS